MSSATERQADFHGVLAASDRSPEIPESADVYGWLCGDWDLEVLRYRAIDVSGRGMKGEVHAARVLDGRAVQDVWIMPAPSWDPTLVMYGTTLRWVLQRQTVTLLVTALTLVLTIVLYVVAPKGFFPIQDTGVMQGVTQAAEAISFNQMADHQQALAKVILADPDVESLSSFIEVDGSKLTAKFVRVPVLTDVPYAVQMEPHLVVEYYSR